MIRLNPVLEAIEDVHFLCPCGNYLPHNSAFIGRRVYCQDCHQAVIMPHASVWPRHKHPPNLAAAYPDQREAITIMSESRLQRRMINRQRMIEEWILAGKIMILIAVVEMILILYITAGRL